MSNEFILIISIIIIYASVLAWYYFFGIKGLTCWTVLATISANIEVLILVDAFGMEQTLGNILFASTFLATDILSEVAGKERSKQAVNIGIATSATFIVITQSWLLYTPSPNDWVFKSIQEVFSNTPRVMIAGLIVYALTQRFDVWAYHKWWKLTTRLCGDSRKYLWLRNNFSTMISQLLNTILFTFGAFWGTYGFQTLVNISIASYVIFIITSLADTPAVYLARYIHEKKGGNEK